MKSLNSCSTSEVVGTIISILFCFLPFSLNRLNINIRYMINDLPEAVGDKSKHLFFSIECTKASL